MEYKIFMGWIFYIILAISFNKFTFKNSILFYGHLLMTDLANSDVSFIRRQANSVAHSLAREALSNASFQLHLNIPHCNLYSFFD